MNEKNSAAVYMYVGYLLPDCAQSFCFFLFKNGD